MWMNCPPNLTLFSPDPFISGRSRSWQLWDNSSSWLCPPPPPPNELPRLLRLDGSHSSVVLMLHMSCSFSESYKHKTQKHTCSRAQRKRKGEVTFCFAVMVRQEVAVWLFEALLPSHPARSAVLLPLFVLFLHVSVLHGTLLIYILSQMSWFNQNYSLCSSRSSQHLSK